MAAASTSRSSKRPLDLLALADEAAPPAVAPEGKGSAGRGSTRGRDRLAIGKLLAGLDDHVGAAQVLDGGLDARPAAG